MSIDWPAFVTAGDAVFTVEKPDKSHYTYRVQYAPAKDNWPATFFVKLLVGPDNTCDYVTIGRLIDQQCVVTRKSMHKADSPPVKLLNRVLYRLFRGELALVESHGYKVYHVGRCARCFAPLTVPESIERGFGPHCWEKSVCSSSIAGLDRDLLSVQ